MALRYDRSFAPYVVPAGGLLDGAAIPEPLWAAKMALGQLRAHLGAAALHLEAKARQIPLLQRAVAGAAQLRAAVAPEIAGRMATDGDAEFAYARLAGTNPFQIRRVRRMDEIPAGLQLSDTLLGQLTGGGPTFAERLAAGQLLVVRYDELAVGGQGDLQARKLVAPVSALFCDAPELQAGFALVPLAIECPPPGPDAPRPDGNMRTVTPLDGAAWRAAKRWVAVADVNAAELVVHLARTHHMVTPFAIALRRCFAPSHPLREFLFPHLRFNLFVDRMAWLAGVQKTGGVLVGSLAGTAKWSQDVAKTLHHGLTFRDQHFERDLQARGLADWAGDYPYRDDGRLLWAAISAFCQGFVAQTYASDAAVAADSELQAFVGELRDPQQGNIRGLLAGARLDTREELAEILTQVVFVAGPVHSLVHYSSAAQLQDPAANPSWLAADPSAAPHAAEPGFIGGMAQYIRVVSTNVRYGRLGDFADVPFGQRQLNHPLIAAFQRDLLAVEAQIERRNQTRLAPFIHLLPSRITNGTSV